MIWSTEFLYLLVLCGLLLCFHDWRLGMLLCIVAGVLADPIRKVLPGQPVYCVVVVGIFVGAVLAGFISRYGSIKLKHLGPLYAAVKTPALLFVLWLGVEALLSYVRYGSPVLIGIGLLSYLAPVPAFLLAYYFGLFPRNLVRFLKVYVLCSMLMLSGVYLSYLGVDWPVLEEVGTGLTIYIPGGILDAFPGFFRSTEIAAWHAGATVCLLLVLVVSGCVRWPRILIAGLVLLLLVAGVLTGRRKMIMEVVIFVCLYSGLLLWFRRGAGRMVLISLLMAGLLAFAGMFGLDNSSTVDRLDPYLQRGTTVFEDAGERFTKLGFNTIQWATRGYGLFGGGLGVASQGGQHFGGGAKRFGGAGEGGLGKITAELGLPGLFLAVWIAVRLLIFQWQMLRMMSAQWTPLVVLWYGLLAFLAANVPMFIVASQAFGDVFILLILGWIFGFTVAISRVTVVSAVARSGTMQGSSSELQVSSHALPVDGQSIKPV